MDYARKTPSFKSQEPLKIEKCFQHREINATTFPVTIKSNSSSDVVFLKLPGYDYKHGHTADKFPVNSNLVENPSIFRNENKTFLWMLSVYTASGPYKINCGAIGIHRNDGSQMPYDWKFNFNWQPLPNPYVMAKRVIILDQLPSPENCGNDQEKILKYTKDKKGKLFKLNLVNDQLKTSDELPHANKLYYFFTIPQDSYEKKFAEPCTIFRAVNNKPLIVIKGYNSTQILPNNTKINVIKFEYLESALTIQLLLKNLPILQDFYKDEEILINKVIFTKDGIKEVPNSNIITKGSFPLNGYEILKFSYEWLSTSNKYKITKIFYFAPPQEQYIYLLEYFLYSSNETVVKPNCSINGFSFGYLYAVGYIEKIVSLDELNANGVAKNGLFRYGSFFSKCAGNRNVLIHASRSAGSRVFMFTYFCCILEAMETDTSINNPMKIIKEIREKRYGGNISSMEYAYLLKALISYFFDNKILIGGNNKRFNFAKEYEDYLYKLEKREDGRKI
ncbi:Hypothetical protein SRAE_2000402600 [Strongyloides ratti]|uniref:Uncharacterized protein n=1 Tax=Strongyloides ratti TaxID=34506 RepID=A0A090LI09_STRRB|nr:Hypothetical protein SRAE_2000402600 [Strongyloides ratti]CEF69377.1 Hypothetical protein SRAE_2000402600 [Strongyloides ratti]